MKPITIFYFLTFAFAVTFLNLGKAQNMSSNKKNGTVFSSEYEAAQKAKRDLIEILKSNEQINLGVTLEMIEKSSEGTPMRHVNLDFEKLLDTGSMNTIKGLISDDINTVVPLTYNDRITSIVEVYEKKDGWRIAGLGGVSLTNDLNIVRSASQSDEITIYQIPNLQGTIYGVSRNGKEIYFTNYSNL